MVVVVDRPDLMGIDMLSHFDVINLDAVNHIRKPLQEILDEHAVVLNKDLGSKKVVWVILGQA